MRIRNKLGAAHNQYQLGLVAQREKNFEGAEAAYRGVLKTATGVNDLVLKGASLLQIGSLLHTRGEHEQAQKSITTGLRLSRKVKDKLTEASALYYIGLLRAHDGDVESARSAMGDAHEVFAALDSVDAEKVARELVGLQSRTTPRATEPRKSHGEKSPDPSPPDNNTSIYRTIDDTSLGVGATESAGDNSIYRPTDDTFSGMGGGAGSTHGSGGGAAG